MSWFGETFLDKMWDDWDMGRDEMNRLVWLTKKYTSRVWCYPEFREQQIHRDLDSTRHLEFPNNIRSRNVQIYTHSAILFIIWTKYIVIHSEVLLSNNVGLYKYKPNFQNAWKTNIEYIWWESKHNIRIDGEKYIRKWMKNIKYYLWRKKSKLRRS